MRPWQLLLLVLNRPGAVCTMVPVANPWAASRKSSADWRAQSMNLCTLWACRGRGGLKVWDLVTGWAPCSVSVH